MVSARRLSEFGYAKATVAEAVRQGRLHHVVVAGYELDCHWEAENFAVELDSYATHGSSRSFEADREREDDLLLAGIELIRVTEMRLAREPKGTIARVAAHLARRRARRRRTIRPRRTIA